MLEIYDADLTKADIVDINAEFSKTLITVDDNMKRIVKAIDQGELIDSNKFGVALYVSELSKGYKCWLYETLD